MIRNYLIVAWRNLIKSKVYSIINILGLAAGMAVAMLIAFWIWDEVTYDRYHANHDQLAQVMTTFIDNDSKFGSDFKNISMASWNFGHVLGVGDKKITANGMWVESNFASMFTVRMVKGNIN